MSVWEYFAAVQGYISAHYPEQQGLAQSEIDEIWDWMQAKG